MKANVILMDAVSSAGSPTSGIFDLVDLTTFCVGITFTGSNVVGTLTLEASQDGTNFFTVSGSSQAVTASTGHVYDVTASGYRYVRVKFTYTSGTGNATVLLTAKESVFKNG